MRYTLSSCNGLHLFCCYNVAAAEGNSRSETSDSYYVLNLVTYQHVVVASPCVTSLDQTYAAIAYDASASCFFRIVQFQGFRCLNVYNSENRSWKKLTFRLEYHVVMAEWIEEYVF